jgi:hypothetical protein
MLQELGVFGIVLGVSLFFRYLLSKGKAISPFYGILLRLDYIGVVIHELSHYLISLLVGIKPRKIKIKYRHEKMGYIAPHGSVQVKPESLLQGVLMALAPLYVSTWFAVLFFTIFAYSNYWFWIRLIALLLLISTIMGAAPSSADISFIFHAVSFDPLYALYQCFLLIISIVIVWGFLSYFEIVFLLDVFYYISIAVIYWCLKLTFIGISKGLYLLRTKQQKSHKLKIRRFARRRYKPKKPYQIGIEEAQW